MARVAVVIPALDEERAIGLVLGAIPRDLAHDVIVVDNGSRDRTAAVARALHAHVVSEGRRGYGHDPAVRAARKKDVTALNARVDHAAHAHGPPTRTSSSASSRTSTCSSPTRPRAHRTRGRDRRGRLRSRRGRSRRGRPRGPLRRLRLLSPSSALPSRPQREPVLKPRKRGARLLPHAHPPRVYLVKRREDGSGAVYEVLIPWSVFRENGAEVPPSGPPPEGFTFGFDVALTDDDGEHDPRTGSPRGAEHVLGWTPSVLLHTRKDRLYQGLIPEHFARVRLR